MQNFGAFIAGIVALVIMYRVLFSGKDDFFNCIKFWFTPDVVSMFRGEYWEDHWAEFKLLIWLGSGVGVWYGFSSL